MPTVSAGDIAKRILVVRGSKVMVDADLALLYAVETRVLIQALKRNWARFPDDFVFQLTPEEAALLRSQIVISKTGRGGRRSLPYVFTEHGIAMLSSVLNSKRAIEMSILIIRAFVKLREVLANRRALAARIERLEASQKKHASIINILAEEISDLRAPKKLAKRRIGFNA